MTSRDDHTRAAVAPMLAELRGDLLQLPDEHVVEQHLGMMALEATVLATPKIVERRTRHALPHSKRAVIALVAAVSTLVSCGLSAAGALPAPLQHITETIARTFGVPSGEPTSPADLPGRAAPPPAQPAARVTPPTDEAPAIQPAPTTTPKATKTPTTKASSSPSTTDPLIPPSNGTPIATVRPHVPGGRIDPGTGGPRPSNNSSNTPPGFPTDWRAQAVAQAAVQLSWVCTVQPTLDSAGCPQQVTAHDGTTNAQSVEWTLLNDPTVGAAVLAKTRPGDPAHHIAPTTNVIVYVAFQMKATYTAADGSGPYVAYSSGIGAATMRWNGSFFADVSFTQGSVAGQLLPGVKPPVIPRFLFADDASVLAAVRSGFAACAAAPGAVIPVCPQTTAAGEQWTVTGDPTQGAAVTYDPTDGLFTVTGTYAMTSNLGNTAGGAYTASVFYNGTQLEVLSITRS